MQLASLEHSDLAGSRRRHVKEDDATRVETRHKHAEGWRDV